LRKMKDLGTEVKEITEEVFEIVTQTWAQPNCSLADGIFDPPPSQVFLTHLFAYQVVLLVIATVISSIVLVLAVVQWYHVWIYISNEKRQNKLYFLISLLPVSTLCCLVGMYAPRTAAIITSLGVLYFLLCLFVLVSLIRHLFGGRSSFSSTLQFDEKPINFQSPPFCCCCFFLPSAQSTERNLRRMEWCVLQAPVVRAIIVASNVVAVAELRDGAQQWLHLSEIGSVASLLLAIFGVHTMARLTSDKLSAYGFMAIFRMVDIALLFFTAQEPMLFENVLIRFGVITCGPLMSAKDNAKFVCNFVIICEMGLMSILSTILMSPSRSELFDRYRQKSSRLQLTSTDDTMLTSDFTA